MKYKIVNHSESMRSRFCASLQNQNEIKSALISALGRTSTKHQDGEVDQPGIHGAIKMSNNTIEFYRPSLSDSPVDGTFNIYFERKFEPNGQKLKISSYEFLGPSETEKVFLSVIDWLKANL